MTDATTRWISRALAALAACWCAACSAGAAPDLEAGGPPVAFARKGASVCAAYAIDGSFELYRERVFARSAGAKAPVSGLPKGFSKPGAPPSEAIVREGFKACAKAASESAPMEWIDQSCAAGIGLCLPPRGFEVDAAGTARPMDPSKAGAAFAAFMGAPAAPAGDGWGSMRFNPAK